MSTNNGSCGYKYLLKGEIFMGLYVEGDVPYVANGNCGNYNNNGWNDWSWIIGLIAVAGLFGGGFGNGGLFGNRGGNCATQADLSAGFSTSEIMSDLNDIILGQAQMQNFINQGFAGINQTVTNGFAGVNNAICTLGYQNQAGFNALGTQIADCLTLSLEPMGEVVALCA